MCKSTLSIIFGSYKCLIQSYDENVTVQEFLSVSSLHSKCWWYLRRPSAKIGSVQTYRAVSDVFIVIIILL